MGSHASECLVKSESSSVESRSTAPQKALDNPSIPIKNNDDERAAANVAEWRKYLPEDCVESMIKDGWHRTV
jgi:hypothetical protein